MGLRIGLRSASTGLTHVVTTATGDHLTVSESELTDFIRADDLGYYSQTEAVPETVPMSNTGPSRENVASA
jgi:hypothetical protein